ncbi:PASTA domain-containing protein [Pedobacter sp. NJ-S-72]
MDLLLGNGQGNEDVEIPALLGFTKDEAAFSLRGSNLKLGTITYEGSITDTANAVIVAQSPALSDTLSKVKIGTPVNITLSNKK